jgi:hypothetical protein
MNPTVKKISPLFFLFFLGCQSEDVSLLSDNNHSYHKKDKNITKSVQRNEEHFLETLGVSYKQDKIIIDLNKTNHFFVALEKRADEKAKVLEKKLNEINMSKEAGILVDQTSLSVDLNKTHILLENLSNLFENVLFDINRTNP